MNLLIEVTEVFRNVFDDEDLIVTPLTNAAMVDGWDSFAHIMLVVALEERFNVKFTTKELSEMAHVGDLLKLLKNKGAQ
jgi:acyl carrier protein